MAEACTTATTFTQKRTLDVKIKEDVDFESLLLSDEILFGLKKCGFQKPSPVQLKAIPLGRCGLDLIVQAKSGTGKTCVFSVIALESIFLNASGIQVLVLAPTREIAVQIWQVIHSIGAAMPKLRCYTFIGGMPLSEDKVKLKKCHIAVGTPGRVKQLIEEQILNTESVRLFVLDEADKLMEHGFQETINWIFSSLPENKQMLALSATYPEVLAKHLTVYMRNPTFVRLNTDDLSLIGIRQYYKTVQFSPLQQKAFEIKCKVLLELLNAISFQQCLVFSNYQLRAQSLSDILNKEGWPATFISGSQDQQDRLTAMAKLKMFRCRVLISTDLISRGIDAQNVNLIINMDIPHDHETYLHRIGRAGRYGTYGAAITLVSLGKEMADLKTIEAKANTKIVRLPDPVPAELAQASGFMDYSDHITVQTMENSHYKPGKVLDNVCDLNSAKSSTADEELSSLSPAMGKDEQKGYVKDTVANYQENPQQDCIEVVDSISELHDLSKTPLEQENGNHFKMVDDYSTEDGTNPTAYCEENKSKKQNVSIGTESEQSDQDLHCENAMNRTENQQEDRIISTFTRSSSHYLKLPNPQLLHKFSNHLKSNNFCVQDFTLPTLIEVIGHKSKTNSSYSNMVADYECFRKGETPDTSEKCNHDFYESQVYDTALKKVNACMKNLFHGRFCHDLPFTDNSSNIICAQQGHSFTSEKALEVVHGAVEHNSQILYTASKAGDDFLNDLPSNTSVTDDGEKIISFSELNSYFNKADDHKITSSHFAKKKKKSEQVKSQFDGSGHTVEDQKLGLDLMRKLQAQCETDSDSSWFDSQSDVNEYSEVPSSEDGEEYVSDCDKHQIMQEHMHRYSYPPTYEQNTGIYGNQSPFNPWYYPQDSMNPAQLPQGCATSACYMGNGYSMGAPIYGGIFPHQLWMQCANLLGSVNAMQAAHYSWYCQIWHTYHMQCAQAYTSYYNKFRSRFEGHKHDKL